MQVTDCLLSLRRKSITHIGSQTLLAEKKKTRSDLRSIHRYLVDGYFLTC